MLQSTDCSLVTFQMFDPSQRRLLHALILSLAVHAVILLGVVSELPSRPDVPAAPIKVVFSAAQSKAAVVASDAKSSLVSPPPRPRPAAVPKAHSRQLVVEASPVAVAVPPPAKMVAAEPVVAPPESVDSATRPADVQTKSTSSAPTPPQDGLNANDLRQYRLSLAIAARRFKLYPAMARERGWEGTAEVALTVRAHQSEPEVVLVRSSGYPSLDRQAQEMMAQAARATMLPESLKGRDLRLLLPVQFSLEGNQ